MRKLFFLFVLVFTGVASAEPLVLHPLMWQEMQAISAAGGGGGSGDITDVGDCAGPACFNGTDGTTLTFNNAGGDGTLIYDGTDFTFDKGIIVTPLTASRLLVTDASKRLASNGAITTNAVTKSASSGASLAASTITDDGTTITLGATNTLVSALTASRLVVSDASKNLISNAALTTNTLPKAASSGASLANSTVTDDGTIVTVNTASVFGASVADDNTRNFLKVTGTMPAVPSAAVYGALFDITGAGSAAQTQFALRAVYNAGYTGSSTTRAGSLNNTSAGTGASVTSGLGNMGSGNSATGTTTGHNFGTWSTATGGNANYGVAGLAITDKANATNIGGAFFGRQTTATPINIGVFGGLMTSVPTFVSAAALFDNGTSTDPILMLRDNGTAVVTIADGGTGTFTASNTFTGANTFSNNLILTLNTGNLFAGTSTAQGVIGAETATTPDASHFLTGNTSNSWYIAEYADKEFDFNNGPCGTAACVEPTLIIHSADQDVVEYQSYAAYGTAGKVVKTLTESAATSIVRIPVASGAGTGGAVYWSVFASDATDHQVRNGSVNFAVVNKAGTETCTISAASEAADGSVIAASSGTLTYGITCDTTPANAVDIQLNAVSSLTQSTLEAYYRVDLIGPGLPARQ